MQCMTYATKSGDLSTTNVAGCTTVAGLAAFTLTEVGASLVPKRSTSEHSIEECRKRGCLDSYLVTSLIATG